MTFHSPIWLYAGLVAAAAMLALYYWSARRQRKLLSDFASERLLPELARTVSKTKILLKKALTIFGVLAVFAALARPQWGYRWEETKTRGIDIIFAIDTSNSMLAEDVKPNRLERAKLAVLDLVNILEGDRIGIVAFSGQAFLQCPLTLDYDAFRMSLEALDTEVIQRGGTNIAAAIDESEVAFSDTSNHKIIVLISDGEELESSAMDKAKQAKERGVTIYTLGVGNAKGEFIPVRDENGRLTNLKDENGNLVKSRLNEEVLTKIAEETGGFYEPLSATGMDTIYTEGLKKIPQQELSSRMKQFAIERFQIPIAIAIILIALESLIGTRKFFTRGRGALPLLLLAAIPALSPCETRADTAQQQPQARELFNAALDEYANKEYIKSKELFQAAMKAEESDFGLHSKAFYNMGNADYEIARQKLANVSSPEEISQKAAQLSAGADQMIAAGSQLVQRGQPLLKQEEQLLKSAKTEEEKKQAMQNSPLKADQQLQQQLKQAISQCESIEKEVENIKKEFSSAQTAWQDVQSSAKDAINNFNSSLQLDREFEPAQKNLSSAKTASSNLEKEIQKTGRAIEAMSSNAQKLKEKSLAELKEELKKLVRDDNNQNQDQQNQDNQQNQQNQQNNQNQNSQQNQQDQNQQQNKDNQQNQNNSQEQQQDQQKQDKDNKQDKGDKSDQPQNQDRQDSQKDKNILTLETGVYEGEEARTAKLVLETSGAEPCVVEIRQNPKAVVSGDYKLGDIVKNSAGDAVGIVVKEKTADPGLIMSLKSWRSGSFFTSEIVPELLNSKDGEENTNKILESYTEADCPGLYAALNEANNGDSGWFLPSPENMWDAMTYFTGINYDRTISDEFSYNWGTNAVCDDAQFNKINRLITQAGGEEVHRSMYHVTSMIGVKYGSGTIYYMVWGQNQPYGAAYAERTYDESQLDGSSYVIRLFKKY